MATEKRLIDANALAKEIDFEYDLNYGEILTDPRRFAEMVEDAPTVDAVEVVHGVWEKRIVDYEIPNYVVYDCSICGFSGESWYEYCPHCGAKMDGDGNG